MNEKFGMGAMGFGPLPGMTETMDFVKRAWSSFNLPSSMTPTLDVEELDKRIADLRTVEQWLSLNLGMLQNAIQGMEIQRGTIAALKAFGTPGALDAGTAAAQALAAMGGAHAASASPDTTRPASRKGDSASGTPRPVEAPEPAAKPFSHTTAAAIDPAAWWGLLQSQFSQVAQAAMEGASAGMTPPSTSVSSDPTKAAKSRPRAGRKPAPRKAGAGTRTPTG